MYVYICMYSSFSLSLVLSLFPPPTPTQSLSHTQMEPHQGQIAQWDHYNLHEQHGEHGHEVPTPPHPPRLHAVPGSELFMAVIRICGARVGDTHRPILSAIPTPHPIINPSCAVGR